MPTTAMHTFSGKKLEPFYDPDLARSIAVRLPASVTLARGTILAEVTATPGTFNAYNNAGAGGLEVAKGILAFDCKTDANGRITYSTDATAGEFGETHLTVPMYYSGVFKTSELTGLDAAGLADMGGSLLHGTIADGVASIG